MNIMQNAMATRYAVNPFQTSKGSTVPRLPHFGSWQEKQEQDPKTPPKTPKVPDPTQEPKRENDSPPELLNPDSAQLTPEGEQPPTLISPADIVTDKREKPSLDSFIQDLLTQGQRETLVWTSSGTNLETVVNGYPVRLAEIEVAQGFIQYKFQVFPKGLFSGFRSPLYNIDAPASDPTGQNLGRVYQYALTSLPELYESDRGKNRGVRLFNLGRTRFALVFPQNRQEAERLAGSEDVLFFVKKKGPYYGFNELSQALPPASDAQTPAGAPLQPVLSEGYVDSEEYVPMVFQEENGQVIKEGLSKSAFEALLTRAGVTLQRIIAKGTKLLQDLQR